MSEGTRHEAVPDDLDWPSSIRTAVAAVTAAMMQPRCGEALPKWTSTSIHETPEQAQRHRLVATRQVMRFAGECVDCSTLSTLTINDMLR